MTATRTGPRLSPALRHLCARLAMERTKAAAWALAAEPRREVHAGIDSGEPTEVLQADPALQIEVLTRRG